MSIYSFFWLAVVVASILYIALMIWFLSGYTNLKLFSSHKKVLNSTVSLVVPFNNELENISNTIENLLRQQIQTTEYEIIFVDDLSTDGCTDLVKNQAQQFRRLQYVLNEGRGKKAALETGIKNAQGDIIILTDADCFHDKEWVHYIVSYFEEHQPDMLIGPVELEKEKTLFNAFQQLEFASLVGSGAGAAGINHGIMCNGANLAFKKSVYDKFEDPFKREYISGDDIFLLQNFKQLGAKIEFIKAKQVLVKTKATKTLADFIKQRTRWTSKASGYQDADTLFSAMIVFSVTVLLFLNGLLMVKSITYWKSFMFLFAVKTLMDGLFFYKISDFFSIRKLIKWTVFFQIIYMIYIPTISFLSLFKNGKQSTP